MPDRHGTGTNALLLTPPEAITPAFGKDSCNRHGALADEAGVGWTIERVPSLMLDVDTPEDLAVLAESLGDRRGLANRTRGTLSQIERLRERPPVTARVDDAPAAAQA